MLWGNALVWLLLVGSAFRGPLGEASFDTKSDLVVDAGRFLRRSLHLWNDQASFGELQNQAYGYLFPQGAFAWLGQLVGLPAWLVQRLWVAVLLVVAYEGVRRLFLQIQGDRVGTGAQFAAALAGLAYVAAPRIGGIAGVLSSEVNPPALLPWAVLAVAAYSAGRISARTAGLSIGVAVLAMGGVNAVAVVACLPLLVIAVVGMVPNGYRRPIAAWATAGVAAAVAWWLGPLLLLGRYSPPFLDFIETSEATTSPLGWANVVRGAVHWVAFTASGSGPSLPGAYTLHGTALGVLVTWAVAVPALLGLTRRDMPYRRALVASLVLGVVALGIGHTGPLAGPLEGPVRWLLDGPLAMLRNVHKIDPLVRLPLALGLGHAALCVVARSRERASRFRLERLAAPALAAPALAAALAVVALAPLAVAPERAPGWRDFPRAWSQAAQYVERQRPTGTTLVLPATGFGDQTWGRTVDEPIQSVGRTPWVSRSQVPLSPPQTIRFLDAVVARTEDPAGGAALADVLARAGVRTVMIRHDLLREVLDPEVTRRVVAALDAAPGITREARFGTDGTARVDVYGVDRDVPVVDAVEADSLAWVRGGAEDVVSAVEEGVLDADRPAVMVGDAGPLTPSTQAPDVVGDALARRERAFGLVRESVGPVLGAREPFTTDRPVHDYPGTPGTPLGVAEYDGALAVRASSSTASARSVGPVRPDQGPAQAVDGDLRTMWRSDAFGDPTSQWWQIDLGTAGPVAAVTVVAAVNPLDVVPIRRLVVTTDDGQRVVVPVHPETGEARATLSGSAVSRIRVAVDAVAGDWDQGSVGLAEVGIPGVQVTKRLVVPPATAGAGTSFVFRTTPSRRACAVVDGLPSCAYDAARGQEEGGGLRRTFTLDDALTATVRAKVRAVPGSSTAALFDPLGSDALTVHADSVFADDPAVVGAFAMDGDPRSHWLAQPLARSATLSLTTGRAATISGLSVSGAKEVATLPTTAVVSNGASSREVALSGGSGSFEPLTGRRFTVTLRAPADTVLTEPLGVGELTVRGLERRVYRSDLTSRTGAQCGLGPAVVIDGRTYDTRVTGTLGAVRDGDALTATVCDGAVRLGPGVHHLEWRPSDRFEVDTVTVRPRGTASPPAVRRSTGLTVVDPSHRVVTIGPGADAVLRVAQNFNAGWKAELDGVELPAIRVDGWQQGFVVPAGEGGDVHLVFAPDASYRIALLVGGVLAALLVVGAAVSAVTDRAGHGRRVAVTPARSPRPVEHEGPGRAPRRGGAAWRYLAFVVLCALLGGVAGLAGALVWAWPAVRSRTALLAGAALVVAAVGQLVWVVTGGSPVASPTVVDLLVGASLALLVASSFSVPGLRARTEGAHG